MKFSTISIGRDVAQRLREQKMEKETYSDVIVRLLDNQPPGTVGDWLASLASLEGRGVFTVKERENLKGAQIQPTDSRHRRRGARLSE